MASQYGTSITFGTLTIYADKIIVKKMPGAVNQVVGKRLVRKQIPGKTTHDWMLTIDGRHPDTNRHNDRETLEGYHDLKKHALVDGIHDGDYFVTDLQYNDTDKISTQYSFKLILIQDQ